MEVRVLVEAKNFPSLALQYSDYIDMVLKIYCSYSYSAVSKSVRRTEWEIERSNKQTERSNIVK